MKVKTESFDELMSLHTIRALASMSQSLAIVQRKQDDCPSVIRFSGDRCKAICIPTGNTISWEISNINHHPEARAKLIGFVGVES